MGTPDGDLTLDEWAACADAALEPLQREIDALDDASLARFADALLRQLAPPQQD